LELPDHVAVSSDEDRKVGEGCYVSTTIHNRRYYGVLIDQASLKAASMLFFQDEASGLDLNRKMELLLKEQQPANTMENGNDSKKRFADADPEEFKNTAKRPRLDPAPDTNRSSQTEVRMKKSPVPVNHKQESPRQTEVRMKKSSLPENHKKESARPVQKFRYVMPEISRSNDPGGLSKSLGYRVLLATYVDVSAAADDDPEQTHLIQSACQSGGNFVGQYYYQYEVSCSGQISNQTSTSICCDGHLKNSRSSIFNFFFKF
jgi:hypothetical protein